MRKRYILTLSTILALFSIFAVPVFASDATLFLSPITGTYITGDVFTISVNVDSGGAAVNAIEGKLEYDPKELTVIDIDTTSPIVTSWVQQPTFDNSSGVISFGGSLATSTVLSRQSVFKFRLRGERSGEFRVRFITGAAIHAADGTGGNIVSTLSNGIYAIVPSVSDPDVVVTVPTVESSSLGEVLGAATGTSVMSSTHPDQNTWYPLATSSLSWDLPLGLSAVRLSLDKKPNGQGVVEYAPTVHDKVINKIRDGVSYFHLTRIYQDGSTETSHYKLMVDTTPPANVTAREVSRTDPTDPRVSVAVSATDTASGVDHYEFVLDRGAMLSWIDNGEHRYSIPNAQPGAHELSVAAVDKAGNRSSVTASFAIEDLPTPVITIVKTALSEADTLKLSAATVPNATLVISVQKGDSSAVTEEFTVDNAGRGEFESALTLSPGMYRVSAIAHTSVGGASRKSEDQIAEVSSSFAGVVKRHPLVPVAALALIVLTALSWYLLRRGTALEEEGEEDPDQYLEEEVARDEYVPRTPASPAQFAGTVVLEKRKKVEMPFTRL